MTHITKLHETAWEVKNFLSEEERSVFMEFIESLSEEDWYSDKTAPEPWQGRAYTYKNLGQDLVEKINSQIEQKVFSSFDSYSRIHQISSILRASPGQSMGVHRDDVEEEDKVNMYGIVIYLNDDYEGGEIVYPDYGVEHKPVAGSMVVHRASTPHGVTSVTGDKVRYILTSFVKGDSSTKFMGE